MNTLHSLKKTTAIVSVSVTILIGLLLSRNAPEVAVGFIAVTAIVALAVQDYHRAHYNFRSLKRHY